jgi:hypothetical protein
MWGLGDEGLESLGNGVLGSEIRRAFVICMTRVHAAVMRDWGLGVQCFDPDV